MLLKLTNQRPLRAARPNFAASEFQNPENLDETALLGRSDRAGGRSGVAIRAHPTSGESRNQEWGREHRDNDHSSRASLTNHQRRNDYCWSWHDARRPRPLTTTTVSLTSSSPVQHNLELINCQALASSQFSFLHRAGFVARDSNAT